MKAIRNKNHFSLTVTFEVITWQGLKGSRDIISQIIPQSLKPNFTIQGASTYLPHIRREFGYNGFDLWKSDMTGL